MKGKEMGTILNTRDQPQPFPVVTGQATPTLAPIKHSDCTEPRDHELNENLEMVGDREAVMNVQEGSWEVVQVEEDGANDWVGDES